MFVIKVKKLRFENKYLKQTFFYSKKYAKISPKAKPIAPV